jgi:hypothetical protein
MPKVSIPKNTWIDQIVPTFFDQGYYAGRYGIDIYFSGGDCPSPDFMAEVVESILKVKMGTAPQQFPIIRLRGLFAKNGAEDMLALIKLLQTWKFQVHVLLNDDVVIPWFDVCNWRILVIKKPRLVNVTADEIWYTPLQQTGVEEPLLPADREYQLFLEKGLPQSTTIDFICKSKRIWRLL